MICSVLLYGGLSRSFSVGSPVARANEARESMIMFTQRSWIGWRTDSFKMQAETKATTNATTLMVSWNYKNLLMLS